MEGKSKVTFGSASWEVGHASSLHRCSVTFYLRSSVFRDVLHLNCIPCIPSTVFRDLLPPLLSVS